MNLRKNNAYLRTAMLVLTCAAIQELPEHLQKQRRQENAPPAQSVPLTQDPSKKHTNALAGETSPYLLKHAHNPVNWYPWGDEALEKAKKENKQIFLSIGYSSCHWCHVMERESFLDEEIANFLNDHFVCIKVDREERPDIDSIYMESLHVYNRIARSGRGGGWPLSMFLTPDGRPHFGGTYFPPRDGDRGAKMGFLSIIKKVEENWRTREARVTQDANLITRITKRSLAGREPNKDAQLDANWVKTAVQGLHDNFDPDYGGFRYHPTNPKIPKFPEPSILFFLLDEVRHRPDNERAQRMLVTTCQRMMMGGIRDHFGGGFHRYSVDRQWEIPHFEKMLYDNGQLASVYAEAHVLTKRDEFRWVVDETLQFVLREMRDDGGAFYAALDAESDGVEGKFYRWEREEIRELLPTDDFNLIAKVYGLNNPPNFEGKYIAPQLRETIAERASEMSITPDQLRSKLTPMRDKLFEARSRRKRPLTDTKILAAWNGMMIRGFADAGRIFKNQDYLVAAAESADFVLDKMAKPDGRLFRTYTDGQAKLNAYLDDYANLIDGLLALHRATNNPRWLEQANRLQKKQNELFWDDKHGGYFFTSNDHEVLLARGKKLVDGAVPSGNSVSAGNLIYLAQATDNKDYLKLAESTVLSASGLLDQFPTGAPRILISARQLLDAKTDDSDDQ